MNDPRETTLIDKAIFAASVITRANAHHQCADDAAPKRNVVMVRMIWLDLRADTIVGMIVPRQIQAARDLPMRSFWKLRGVCRSCSRLLPGVRTEGGGI